MYIVHARDNFFLSPSLSLFLSLSMYTRDYIQRVEIAYIDERHNSSCVFSLPFSRAVDKHIYIYIYVYVSVCNGNPSSLTPRASFECGSMFWSQSSC